jgi:hypothetical protein
LGGSFRAFFRLTTDGDRDAEIAGFSLDSDPLIRKFELALRYWGTTPEYLLENWTDEQFERFWTGFNENRAAESSVLSEIHGGAAASDNAPQARSKRVSDVELFQQMGIGSA